MSCTIKIFLVDGNPAGLRTVEIGLFTLKALIAPRAEVEMLRGRQEPKKTSVYVLLGEDDDAVSGFAICVGEGDAVLDRILKHAPEKDFWHTPLSKKVNRSAKEPLPRNNGKTPDKKLRHRDCAVLNFYLTALAEGGLLYDTVRCAFVEGGPAFPGSGTAARATSRSPSGI